MSAGTNTCTWTYDPVTDSWTVIDNCDLPGSCVGAALSLSPHLTTKKLTHGKELNVPHADFKREVEAEYKRKGAHLTPQQTKALDHPGSDQESSSFEMPCVT